MNSKLVSIILPVFNAEAFLPDCLESILSQNYDNLEIIAIDDFSKDSSYKILKNYRKKDKRLHIRRNVKRYGPAITLNRAIKLAKGRFITFMNPKDTWTKDKIRKQVEYLEQQPKIVAIGTQSVYVNEQKKRIGKSYFPTETHLINKTIFTGFALESETVLIDRHMLPSDLLFFRPTPNKNFTYTNLLVKLLKYGNLTNLDQQLQTHVKEQDYLLSLRTEMLQHCKLWFQARFVYDLRLPLQTLFYPLVR
ncbi:MAG TPA: glycosyltransferase family 2 protein [Patescibacteria group bacterium]|nr:glycosyltransferase family 2 protein [Patescibacteria group bacterium]